MDIAHEFYEWACFTAQQSAEKVLKGLGLNLVITIWGHSLNELLVSQGDGYFDSKNNKNSSFSTSTALQAILFSGPYAVIPNISCHAKSSEDSLFQD